MMRLLGGKSTYNATSSPSVIEITETSVDTKTSDLKDDTHFFEVSTGITSKAPMSKPPIVLIPTQTTMAKIQK
jgi:hypothetical protein